MSHIGAIKLKVRARDKYSRDIERLMRKLPRAPRALIRKTVAEYRRTVASKEIDVTSTTSMLMEPVHDTHTERVRRETWWICGLPIYSREIIEDSNL
jgi:hypothetical protein